LAHTIKISESCLHWPGGGTARFKRCSFPSKFTIVPSFSTKAAPGKIADPNTRACLKALWEEYFDSATAEQMIGLIAETEAGQETKRNVLLIGAAAGAAVASVLCILLLRGR
jgi:hypothetical protein